MNLHTRSINSVTSDAPPKDVNAPAATSAPMVAGATNSELPGGDTASPHRSFVGAGVDREASASASCLPYKLAPVEPAAVEVGCGQAPEVNSISDCGLAVPRETEMGPVVTPALSLSEQWSQQWDRQAAVASLSSPRCEATAVTNSTPSGAFDDVAPVTAAGAASCGPAAISSDDPELDAIISALEAGWLRDGIVMKATALRVAASSLIHPSASCVSIPST